MTSAVYKSAGMGGRSAERQGYGLVVFAAILLAVIGCFNLIYGIAAIANSHVFVANAHYVFGNLRAWGWITLIIGVVQLLAAAGVFTGNQLARWFGVAVLGLNAIDQMVFLPAYPFWSLAIIAMDVVALWGLCAYGSRQNIGAAALCARREPRPGQAVPMLLDLVLIGVAIALDPLPLTAFLVVLPSERGTVKGAAFVFGWLVSLAIVVTVTVLATGNNPPQPNTAPSLASLAVKITLGVVLVVIAVRHIRARSKPKPPKKPPKWQQHVDSMSPWFALALAPTLQPWALIGAGAATVVEAKLSSWESFLALFLYCVLASSSYLAMEIYAVVRPGQSQALMGRFRAWINDHTDQVIIVGSLVIGLWLIAKDIYLIVS